ncbi:hypothetical protein [Actinacidiphila rubida]|uniref:Uncharacterized protein n=1 Tax=Actinacidiphila rubida TaxID=310780 RepID=A0A1H8UBK3_9ACTN|nr:hypothetical protein [Actinacidiphila rubida]SEP00243.1 hypothetical protein SAMN05216267_10683 [Actinacidiphila rubida]
MDRNKVDFVPPLGYCAPCVREGVWNAAVTQYAGTSTCAHHLIHHEGTGELDLPEGLTDSEKQRQVLNQLERRNPTGNTNHF